jgi:hypothetical protein
MCLEFEPAKFLFNLLPISNARISDEENSGILSLSKHSEAIESFGYLLIAIPLNKI